MSSTRRYSPSTQNPPLPLPRNAKARALHVLDIENELSGVVQPSAVRSFWLEYERVVHPGPEDQFVIAVNDLNAPSAWFALPHEFRRVWAGYGPDAADRALVAAVDLDLLAARFGVLVIGSCDGYFADLAHSATGRGVHVRVVTPRDRVPSWQLYLGSAEHLTLSLQPSNIKLGHSAA